MDSDPPFSRETTLEAGDSQRRQQSGKLTSPSPPQLESFQGETEVRRQESLFVRLLRRPSAIIAIIMIGLLALAAVLAPLVKHPPDELYYDHVLEAPNQVFWMGTDYLGRDIFSRVLYGGRISLSVGVLVAAIAMLTGVPLGLVAGFFGGRADLILTAIVDTLMAFPALLLAIALSVSLDQSLSSTVIAITIIEFPRFERVTRAQVLSVKQLDYVLASRAVGATEIRLMARHVLPNSLAPIIVQFSLSVSFAILAEAALSFLGLGVPPPTPTWGFMLNIGRGYLAQAPWLSVFPGLAIMIAVLGFNLLGDALRDVLDPRLRSA